ncbi:MAG TPA: hypothetical protein VFI42_13135 [Thermomicrobiaceae bacterium]|nr:hypothetical protein [Thermomicrobiaceae bacterium]
MLGRPARRLRIDLLVLLALFPLLAGCATGLSGPHYLPADAGVDPYSTVRARAQQYYQTGQSSEEQGQWRKALDAYQQARLWDPDNRQDIADAIGRAQSELDAQTKPPATPPPTPRPVPTRPSAPTPEPTQPPAEAHAQPTPTPRPAATGAAVAGLRAFHSKNFPYSISYPSTWLAKEGDAQGSTSDTFLGEPSKGTGALVIVSMEQVDPRVTLDTLYAATAQVLEAGGTQNVQVAERRQVGGQPAYVLSYRASSDSGQVTARHAIFLTPGFAWHVVLLATPTTTPALLQTYEAMLDSLQLAPGAFPTQ